MTRQERINYHAGFLLCNILLIGEDVNKKLKQNPDYLKNEIYRVELDEEYLWLEGIDYHVRIPDEVNREIFEMKYPVE